MNNTFELEKGKIVFAADKIIITDKAKNQRAMKLFTSGLWVFFGTMSVLRFLRTGDQFSLWTGLIIAIGHFVVFAGFLVRSVQAEIYWEDVRSIKLRSRFGNHFLDIKLKNNRIRRVTQIDDTDQLEAYIETVSLPK